jgi:hypothetical protein
MNINFRKTKIEDASFIRFLFTVDEYETIFYENDTTISEWEERIPYLIEYRGNDNYIICDTDADIDVGWIMYEVLKEGICKLHIIVLKHDLLGNKYGFLALNIMKKNLQNISKIVLDVQQSNKRATEFYKKYGFCIVGEETQPVGETKTENYFNMEYTMKK